MNTLAVERPGAVSLTPTELDLVRVAVRYLLASEDDPTTIDELKALVARLPEAPAAATQVGHGGGAGRPAGPDSPPVEPGRRIHEARPSPLLARGRALEPAWQMDPARLLEPAPTDDHGLEIDRA